MAQYEQYAATHNPQLFVLLKMQNMARIYDDACGHLESLRGLYESLATESICLAESCGATPTDVAYLRKLHGIRVADVTSCLGFARRTMGELAEKIEQCKQGALN